MNGSYQLKVVSLVKVVYYLPSLSSFPAKILHNEELYTHAKTWTLSVKSYSPQFFSSPNVLSEINYSILLFLLPVFGIHRCLISTPLHRCLRACLCNCFYVEMKRKKRCFLQKTFFSIILCKHFSAQKAVLFTIMWKTVSCPVGWGGGGVFRLTENQKSVDFCFCGRYTNVP